ncbi:hypothetical protein D3C78_855030 [compost metagenome]
MLLGPFGVLGANQLDQFALILEGAAEQALLDGIVGARLEEQVVADRDLVEDALEEYQALVAGMTNQLHVELVTGQHG